MFKGNEIIFFYMLLIVLNKSRGTYFNIKKGMESLNIGKEMSVIENNWKIKWNNFSLLVDVLL